MLGINDFQIRKLHFQCFQLSQATRLCSECTQKWEIECEFWQCSERTTTERKTFQSREFYIRIERKRYGSTEVK